MNTNRLDNVADRQRVSHVRDLFFVIMVAMILVFQVVSLSQAPAFTHTSSITTDSVETVEAAQPAACIDPSNETVAALPDGLPLC